MTSNEITELAVKQDWLEPVEASLQKAVSNAFAAGGSAGERIESALHGTWLGHPLHPVLTDIPLGAWTVAVALDAADSLGGRDNYADGSDAAVGIGLIGAAGSAITGLTDWHKTEGDARRIGLVHGLLNVSATTLFAASWVLRRQKKRNAGKICSTIGYLIAGASAYLGGELVYRQKVGVDQPADSA